jgi:beta-fructofuranosidase
MFASNLVFFATLFSLVSGAAHKDKECRPCRTSNGLDASSFTPPLYTEADRPQIHYSASSGFINDPNGLVKSGDTWHLYYQYNPYELVAGNQHWGHATSKDLYTWENHPPAISPGAKGEGIFTGSTVLDVNNTSGLFNDSTLPESRFVAIYTLNTAADQTQNIAFSVDGSNYTKYSGNPVVDLNTTQFRDPKVIYDELTSKWIMAVAHPSDYQVGFYSSSNLLQWTEVSRFGPAGLLGYQYECPNLVKVTVSGGDLDGQKTWLLLGSNNPGAPLGGSAVQYFYGDWNGTHFIAADAVARIADFGKDWYATQVFYNAPEEKAIAIGWASNWQYTNVAPTSPYRNTQSIPRELKMVWTELNPMKWGYTLSHTPYNLESIPHKTLLRSEGESRNHTVKLHGDGAFQINANFTISASALANTTNPTGEFKIYDSSDKKSFLKIGFTFGVPNSLYVDRRFAGHKFADDNPYFTDRFSQQVTSLSEDPMVASSRQRMEIEIIVDRTITEIFAQRGTASATVLTYWDDDHVPASMTVGLGNDAITLEGMQVESIPSTWMKCP